jgi:hypothetical protein
MKPIQQKIMALIHIRAIELLYRKLELIEEQYSNNEILYPEYHFNKMDVLMDIECISPINTEL